MYLISQTIQYDTFSIQSFFSVNIGIWYRIEYRYLSLFLYETILDIFNTIIFLSKYWLLVLYRVSVPIPIFESENYLQYHCLSVGNLPVLYCVHWRAGWAGCHWRRWAELEFGVATQEAGLRCYCYSATIDADSAEYQRHSLEKENKLW